MKGKNFNFLLSLLILLFVDIAVVKADDFDLSNEREVLFASKRSKESVNPTKTKYSVLQSINNKTNLVGLNLFVYDKMQGKYLPMYDGMKVRSNSEYGFSFERYSNRKIYAYAYRVDANGKVHQLFPLGKDFYEKNPLSKNVQYELPKSNFFQFGDKPGKEYIYFFMTTRSSYEKRFSKLSKLSRLNAYFKKFSKKANDIHFVKDQIMFNRNGKTGSIYMNMASFDSTYSEKIMITNKG